MKKVTTRGVKAGMEVRRSMKDHWSWRKVAAVETLPRAGRYSVVFEGGERYYAAGNMVWFVKD